MGKLFALSLDFQFSNIYLALSCCISLTVKISHLDQMQSNILNSHTLSASIALDNGCKRVYKDTGHCFKCSQCRHLSDRPRNGEEYALVQ
ncbi:hypothetical protein PIB30_108528, partial [Stylosanthes scabra]|nr:hypothetical protein [Stylosanthes scabra]